ncbi:hypothetical protein CKO11_16865 [Rhodobacter sp. TJ_12]|uniref:DUF6916 family protein n=1 Tax=Rhodobacter sp. TJ_12 TaxID=2029399 RepID=UPI001CBB4F16|nr:hypothetical protein [Rhodobacter sp. TJ_12]MBZ4024119.1 hypothetical protein [Rhodobacter sp. TJ_12]
MPTLEQLKIDDFTPLEGDVFAVSAGKDVIDLKLIEVKAVGAGLRDGGAFSLLWQGPNDPFLPQAIYRFAHNRLGEYDFFLVPVAQNTIGFQYEVIFT